MEITLDMLLESREKRWNFQRQLIQEHPELTLVCVTVIMPGNVKRNTQSLVVAHAAVQSVQDAFDKDIRWQQEKEFCVDICYFYEIG